MYQTRHICITMRIWKLGWKQANTCKNLNFFNISWTYEWKMSPFFSISRLPSQKYPFFANATKWVRAWMYAFAQHSRIILIITETKMSSFWWNLHHWLHRKLSKWQLSVQPVMKLSSKWWHFRFSDHINVMIWVWWYLDQNTSRLLWENL